MTGAHADHAAETILTRLAGRVRGWGAPPRLGSSPNNTPQEPLRQGVAHQVTNEIIKGTFKNGYRRGIKRRTEKAVKVPFAQPGEGAKAGPDTTGAVESVRSEAGEGTGAQEIGTIPGET